MLASRKIQRALRGTITGDKICQDYSISPMTLHNWRKRGLPCIVIASGRRPAIRYVEEEVTEWVRLNRPQSYAAKTKEQNQC